MAPDTKIKINWIAIITLSITVIGLLFAGGGSWATVKQGATTGLSALEQKVDNHIRVEELFKTNTNDQLSKMDKGIAVLIQKVDDLKETVDRGNQKTINAINNDQVHN